MITKVFYNHETLEERVITLDKNIIRVEKGDLTRVIPYYNQEVASNVYDKIIFDWKKEGFILKSE